MQSPALAPDQKALATLSDRELQILAMASDGLLDKEISSTLGISLNTIRTYWSRIRSKMGDAPRTALAAVYIAQQFQKQIQDSGSLDYDWVIDLENDTITRISEDDPTGVIPPGEVMTLRQVFDLCHSEDRPGLERIVQDAKAGELDSFTYFARFLTPTGIMQGHAIIQVVKDETGRATKMLGKRVPNVDARSPSIQDT